MTALILPEIFVLRHGETVWNVEGRMQGGYDSTLSERGHAQAYDMARALAEVGVTELTHRLISSPQGRAVATMRLVFGAAADIATDPRLAEIGVGTWAGLTRSEIAMRWPGPVDEDMTGFYARSPSGESFDALTARCRAFLSDLTGPAVIVTHGMTSRVLRMVALGLGVADIAALPGGQGVVHRIRDGKASVLGGSGLQNGQASGICAT